MRDIRSDWYEPRNVDPYPKGRLIVRCLSPGCANAALMDPRPIFGVRRDWPLEGRSNRFRCVCGGREAEVSYTANTAQANGPVSPDTIRLWL
ncbi:MAG: hypothetical protein EON96_15515 [Caulobacteraceae bacterium]|nr:MAG: hypothetical protein EON96_15515 [Caulobacteraceae bacterium]